MPAHREARLRNLQEISAWVLSLTPVGKIGRDLRITFPTQGSLIVGSKDLTVKGLTLPGATVYIEGDQAQADEHGYWEWEGEDLPYGEHEITAKDSQGLTDTVSFTTSEEYPEGQGFLLLADDDHLLDIDGYFLEV